LAERNSPNVTKDAIPAKRPRAGRNFLAALAASLRRLRNGLSGDRYRPERHYMRGPGPKTREKTERGGGATA
jgi:hypothetical protein